MGHDLRLSVEDLGKRYLIGAEKAAYRTLREAAANTAKAPLRRLRHKGSSSGRVSSMWALRHVEFDVYQGDVVGVIGRNGAGKSTLLKLLAKITPPTEGRMEIHGRIGSLLEVGTGFHPELTGRENIFMSGAMLGMSHREIRSRFDEIVEFSEVAQFLETPVKRYSSGMYVRLAFAVAAHLDPEVLLVDEVLAVGDVRFQKKCLGKMGDIAGEGRTVLFVSHNMSAVGALCPRVILLEGGETVADGASQDVIGLYLRQGCDAGGEVAWQPGLGPGSDLLELRTVRLRSRGVITGDVDITEDAAIDIEYTVKRAGTMVNASIHLLDHMGYVAFVSASDGESQDPGVVKTTVTIPGRLLNDGLYSVTVFLLRDVRDVQVRVDSVLTFTVHDSGSERGDYVGKMLGAVRPPLTWRTVREPSVGTEGEAK